MTLRIRFARAAGATLALSLVATAASAQTDTTRIPVRKDRPATPTTPTPVRKDTPAQTPAPTPAPMAPAPTMMDTTTTTTTTTTTSTTMSTPEAQPMPMARSYRFGNGVYLGLGGGVTSPRGGVARRVLEGGSNYNATASVGWDPQDFPLGLRFDVTYNNFNGGTFGTPGNTRNYDNSNAFAALAQGKFRLPFGRLLGSTSGFYAVGGGGVHHIRNFQKFAQVARVTTNDASIDVRRDNVTRLGVNGGAGFAFGIGKTELFVESRYVRVFAPGRNIDYVPFTLGINIF